MLKGHKPNCFCCICKAKRGERVYSEESNRKRIESRKNNGKPWCSEETIQKISKTLTGHIVTEETIQKIIKANTGKIRTEEQCKKNSESKKGDKHPQWLGGIGNFPYPFDFNEKLKELIRERDNYTCQLCGKPQKESKRKLDVHHIDYIKENLDPNNLLTLCSGCNGKVNFNRKSWIEFFNRGEKLLFPITNLYHRVNYQVNTKIHFQ